MAKPTHLFYATLIVLMALASLSSAGQCKLGRQPRCNGFSVEYTVKRNGGLEPFYGYMVPESSASPPLITSTMIPVVTLTGPNGDRGGGGLYTAMPPGVTTSRGISMATASKMVPVLGSPLPGKDKSAAPLQTRTNVDSGVKEVLDRDGRDEGLNDNTLLVSHDLETGLPRRFYVSSDTEAFELDMGQLAHDYFELCCDGPDEQCTAYKDHLEFAFCYNKDTYMFQLNNGAQGSLEDLEFTNLDGTEGSFADLNLDFHYFAVNPPRQKETVSEETTEKTTARETNTPETTEATLTMTTIRAIAPEVRGNNASARVQEKKRLRNMMVKLTAGWLALLTAAHHVSLHSYWS